MWATTFALWMGSIYAFGISTLAHLFIIAGIVVTVGTFETAKRRPTFLLEMDIIHQVVVEICTTMERLLNGSLRP